MRRRYPRSRRGLVSLAILLLAIGFVRGASDMPKEPATPPNLAIADAAVKVAKAGQKVVEATVATAEAEAAQSNAEWAYRRLQREQAAKLAKEKAGANDPWPVEETTLRDALAQTVARRAREDANVARAKLGEARASVDQAEADREMTRAEHRDGPEAKRDLETAKAHRDTAQLAASRAHRRTVATNLQRDEAAFDEAKANVAYRSRLVAHLEQKVARKEIQPDHEDLQVARDKLEWAHADEDSARAGILRTRGLLKATKAEEAALENQRAARSGVEGNRKPNKNAQAQPKAHPDRDDSTKPVAQEIPPPPIPKNREAARLAIADAEVTVAKAERKEAEAKVAKAEAEVALTVAEREYRQTQRVRLAQLERRGVDVTPWSIQEEQLRGQIADAAERRAEANVKVDRAGLDRARVIVLKAEIEREITRAENRPGPIGNRDLQAAQARLSTVVVEDARADRQHASAAVELAEAHLKEAEANVAYRTPLVEHLEQLAAKKMIKPFIVKHARDELRTTRQIKEAVKADLDHARAMLRAIEARFQYQKLRDRLEKKRTGRAEPLVFAE